MDKIIHKMYRKQKTKIPDSKPKENLDHLKIEGLSKKQDEKEEPNQDIDRNFVQTAIRKVEYVIVYINIPEKYFHYKTMNINGKLKL